jgi:hypothetical protein
MLSVNRWCILGSPRTGSNRLEEAIFLKMPIIHNAKKIMLKEFLQHDTQWYVDNTGKDEIYNLKNNDDFRVNFRNEMNLIMETQPEVGFVMRIFFEPWFGADINYIEFLKTLETYNFKFIKLNRNLFDKILSLTVAEYTNLWQRTLNNGIEGFSINGEHREANKNTKITIPMAKFARSYYYYTKMYDYYLDLYSKHISYYDINYETMEEDCKKLNIPFSDKNTFLKTYTDDYSEIIANYQELKNYFEELKKHG